MYSLLAFKAINNDGKRLVSPLRGTRWKRAYIAPLGETYRLEASNADLKRGFGIFAATYQETAKYGKDVYLVAPDSGRPIVEGESGWRAGAAFVVAGPFGQGNIDEAARIIIAAYRAGYPQVKRISSWAAIELKDAIALCDIASETQDWDALYLAGLERWPAGKWDKKIAELLVNFGGAEELFCAGRDWPQSAWDNRITDALVERADAEYLFLAGRDWPAGRWSENIAEALASAGNAEFLYHAGISWPKKRWGKCIADALVQAQDNEWLNLARQTWPKGRRDELG